MNLRDIDAAIEQLAFGKTTPKVSSCLGMYLSPEVIYLSETHMEKGRLVVDHLVRVPVPALAPKPGQGPGTGMTLNTDFLMDNAKLSALIRQAMSQIRWNSKNVIVTLSHHLGLLRYFTMPAIDPRYWNSAVPLEAKKYIPIPFELLGYDFQVSPISAGAENKTRQGVLFGVTPKKNMPNITALLQSLGLTLLGMEVAPCSVLRMWNSLEKGKVQNPYSHVHFDGGNIRIMVSDNGLPIFFREVFLGAEASVQESRKVDIGGCVSFAQKQLGVAPLQQLRVSGSSPELAKWREIFSQETGVAAVIHDTPTLLGIRGGDWGGYASIGAALKYMAPSALKIDLNSEGRISEAETRTARNIFFVATAVSVLLILGGLFRDLIYSYRARDFKQYKRQSDLETVFLNKSPSEVEEMLNVMQDQAEVLRVMDQSDGIKMTALLKDVVDSLPPKVWLTKIRVLDPVKKGDSSAGGKELVISGHVVGASLSEEQDLALQFRDRLSQAPLLGKVFPELQLSHIHGETFPPDLLMGLDQDALKQKLEQRTEFGITGRSRKKI